MRVQSILLVATAIALLSPSTTAQNPSSAPVIKTRVDLVLVPVIVRDRRGGPVRGLSAPDFILKDNGARQKIASVEEVTTDSQPLLVQSPPPDSTFVTQFSNSTQPKNLVILVLDLINTAQLDQSRARKVILKFLTTQIKSDQLVALVVIEPGQVRLLHAFTSSPSILSAALQRVVGISSVSEAAAPVSSGPLSSAEAAAAESEAHGLNQFVHQANDEMGRSIASMNATRRILSVKATLESLQHIASWVAGISGRKTLIWLTGQVPYVTVDHIKTEDWDRTFQSLANANVALYPVDVRGVLNKDFLAESAFYIGPGPDSDIYAFRGDIGQGVRHP